MLVASWHRLNGLEADANVIIEMSEKNEGEEAGKLARHSDTR